MSSRLNQSNPNIRSEGSALLRLGPADPRTRRAAETAWSFYCPAALLLAALVIAGGCQSDGDSMQSRHHRAPAQLAGQEIGDAVTEAGDAERLERNATLPGESASDDDDAPSDLDTAPAEPLYAAYPVELPLVGTAAARATVRYGRKSIDIANLSRVPWSEGRIWINRKYSAPLPVVAPGQICKLRMDWIRDETGSPFPVKQKDVFVDKVELVLGDERTRVRHGLDY